MEKQIFAEVVTTAKTQDFWIDARISKVILSESTEEAFEEILKEMEDRYFINFSKNARKNKSAMYRDTDDGSVPKQIGWTITGKTQVDFDGDWKQKYVDCWVEMYELKNLEF